MSETEEVPQKKKITRKAKMPTITVEDKTPKISTDKKIFEDEENVLIIKTDEIDSLGRDVSRILVVVNNQDYGNDPILEVNHDNFKMLKRLIDK
jgi:uncharacterized protein (DUF1786 family)